MARITNIVCDRCAIPLTPANWMIDGEICNSCSNLILLGQEGIKQDLILHLPPGATARDWLSQYQSEHLE